MDSKKRILLKLGEMYAYLEQLEELLLLDEEEYLKDIRTKRACEKTLELAIETVISIINIIVSSQKLIYPESEDSLINALENKRILSKKMAKKIMDMKGFRNILVHKYGELDDHRAYKFLTEDVGDFKLFEKEIKKYLKTLK